MVDVGLLVLRLVVGGLLAAHGLQKVAGWFGGPGIGGNAAWLEDLGFRRPQVMSWLHGLAETVGGLSLAVGLLTPLGAATVLAVMLVASVVVHRPNGLWARAGGYEYPLVLSAAAVGLALTGPGAFALDAVLGWELAGAWTWLALVAGAVVGLLALAMRRPTEPSGRPHQPSGRRGSDLAEAA